MFPKGLVARSAEPSLVGGDVGCWRWWLQPGGEGPEKPGEGVGPWGAIGIQDRTWSDLRLRQIVLEPVRRGFWNGGRLGAEKLFGRILQMSW